MPSDAAAQNIYFRRAYGNIRSGRIIACGTFFPEIAQAGYIDVGSDAARSLHLWTCSQSNRGGLSPRDATLSQK